MIVFGHHTFALQIPEFLRRFAARLAAAPSAPPHDTIVDLLVDFGEAHAAAADALCPGRDDDTDVLRAWAAAAHELARAFVASWHGEDERVSAVLRECAAAVESLARRTTLVEVAGRTPEGFAQYALMPEQYALAAERFVAERRPTVVTCVGIRSIGAPLAHVVAAAFERGGVVAPVYTVRPRGHPFDRRLDISDRLEQQLLTHHGGWYAIVDEGPGLSGSSFAAGSDALRALGIRDDQIVLFPSWRAAPDNLRSERGRAALMRHQLVTAPFEDVWDTGDSDDVSAGKWRARVFRDERAWPAVQPQHERRKYLSRNGDRISRFAGLGRYGRSKFDRARALAARGFVPAPREIARGFLTEDWVVGRRLTAADAVNTDVLDALVRYLATLRLNFQTGRAAIVDDLVEMMRVNASDVAHIDVPQYRDEPEVAVDGRMLPHEWVRTEEGLVKTDALDHHADDFLPGARDIAWDVAGAIVEFDLGAAARRYVVEHYGQLPGDTSIADRLPFYERAYLAYRFGYTSMAAESLGESADGRRFSVVREQYRRSLAARAAHPRSAR